MAHLLPVQEVTLEEVLGHFISDTGVPSTFGSQLEMTRQRTVSDEAERVRHERAKQLRMRTEAAEREAEHVFWNEVKVHEDLDGRRRDEEARTERALFDKARVLRCVQALAAIKRITFADCPFVEKFARDAGVTHGQACVGALRAFEEWRTQSSEKGYSAVYAWMRSVDPSLPALVHKVADDAQAFREGKAKVGRRRAALLVADATTVTTAWVERWNLRAKKGVSLPAEGP